MTVNILNTKKNWLLIGTGIAIAAIILYRAISIPFTHDESATWLYLRHTNVWGCFFDPGCWNWGNNHWLNTVLLQFCANIGGESPVVLRIPNILAGWAYLIAAALLVTRYLKNDWVQLTGFLLITLHMYLLDFFSLARGYGMMTSGVMWGIYSLLRYAEKFELRWLIILLISLFLAILSNFTAVIPAVAILGGWFICLLGSKNYSFFKTHGPIVLILTLSTYLLLRLPLKVLSEKGELQWGAEGFNAMGKDLFSNLWAGAQHFGSRDPLILFLIVFGSLLISFGAYLSRDKLKLHDPLSLLFLLLGLVLSVIIAMQIFTDAQAPVGRKSIFLIPFIFSTLAVSQRLINRKTTSMIIAVAGLILILSHFISIFKPHAKSCREWYYDAKYPELFSTIVPQDNESDSVKLGTSWIFVPALTFYQQTKSLPISGLEYQKELKVDTTMDYYYVDPSDTTGFHLSPFVLEKMIGSFCLFKNEQ